MKRNRRIPAIAAMGLVAVLVAGCGGGEADTTTTVATTVATTVVTRSATTVGAVVVEITVAGEAVTLESPLLAVEFADGTQAVVVASAVILEEVGLGEDVITGEIRVVTWGNEVAEREPGVLSYLLFEDDAPDAVLLEESSDGEWTAVSVVG